MISAIIKTVIGICILFVIFNIVSVNIKNFENNEKIKSASTESTH